MGEKKDVDTHPIEPRLNEVKAQRPTAFLQCHQNPINIVVIENAACRPFLMSFTLFWRGETACANRKAAGNGTAP